MNPGSHRQALSQPADRAFLRTLGVVTLVGILLSACSPPQTIGGTQAGGPTGAREAAQAPVKTLVVAARAEPPSLNPKPFRPLGLTADLSGRMFNAGLTIRNDAGQPVPYLAEKVPQLNDSWRVSADGTMESTYQLRPNITWHDGGALTADDFVFAYEVFSTPALGVAAAPPISLMDRVTAPDPRTVVIHWKQTFPSAHALQAGNGGTGNDYLPPLPRHILGQLFQTLDPDAFQASQFWVSQYVGAGPYKLERWETGAFLEGVAFDGHILGKPKIQRIRELFIGDPNTVIANVLSDEAQLTTGDSIRFNDGETLRGQWTDRGKILNFPNLVRISQFQRRPEFASTLAFSDLRVRQALHHGVDFAALNETLAAGRTTAATGFIAPTAAYYQQLDQAVAHYPYDPRKTEQLMTEAGFSRGSDGVWVSPNPQFGRMSFETNVIGAADSDNEMHIMADTWRRLGFELREVSWPASVGSDAETRNSFPGLSTPSVPPGESAYTDYRSDRIPTAQIRWRGGNRGAWPGTPQYDRLADAWETSLNRDERIQAVMQMNRILNEDCAYINLYWKLNAQAVANGLTGPRLTDPDGTAEWSIHEWEFR
jgi:peptide/nickel transport system substrate-binding protein